MPTVGDRPERPQPCLQRLAALVHRGNAAPGAPPASSSAAAWCMRLWQSTPPVTAMVSSLMLAMSVPEGPPVAGTGGQDSDEALWRRFLSGHVRSDLDGRSNAP
jgi:hypothetical protein